MDGTVDASLTPHSAVSNGIVAPGTGSRPRRHGTRSDSGITVGDVEISHLYELVVDFPMTLDKAFPSVPAKAWEPYHDMDGPQAERTRRQLLDRIEAEGLVFSANHFPEPGFGRVVRLEGRRFWQALWQRWPPTEGTPDRT
jgi:hypothetical protein